MQKYKCPKCGQELLTEIQLKEAPVCARKDRKVSHPVKMVLVLVPIRA